MKSGRTIWRISWRLGIGGLLLLWIFHAIFVLEGRQSWESIGRDWEALGLWQRWAVAWRHGPPELWQRLTEIRPGPLLASLFFMGMTIVLGLIRWRQVLQVQGLHLSLARTAEISLVAHFFNSFLLGSTGGDLLKAYYAARETHHKKTEAVVTVVVDRLMGLFAMLFFACVMMIPNFQLLGSTPALAVFAWLILLMMALCGLVVALSFWSGLSRTLPKARDWMRRLPKGDLLERALNASRRFGREPFVLARIFGLSMALNVFCVLQILALARGLNVTIPVVALFVIVPMIVCLSAVPISPSGLGVRENLYVLMLGAGALQVGATAALSISLLAYAGSLFWSVVGGIVYMTRKQRDRLEEIAREEGIKEFGE